MPTYNLRRENSQLSAADFVELPFLGNREFDRVYPQWVRSLSDNHWTPVGVAREAAHFLVAKLGTKVLDIGCGAGKFCAVGAATTGGHFTGIEMRDSLVSIANQTIQKMGLSERVQIIHTNVVEVDFCDYDAFYCFNPFYENIMPYLRIDSTVELHRPLYTLYTQYVRNQLTQAPLGTRVATYHGHEDEIPASYCCEHRSFGDSLKLWVKTKEDLVYAEAEQTTQAWWDSELHELACI